MQRFLTVEEIESSFGEILDGKDLQDDEPIDVVQLPPDVGEADCEDFDDDILLNQSCPRVVSGDIELQNIPKRDEPDEGPSVKRSRKEVVSLWRKTDAKYIKKIKEGIFMFTCYHTLPQEKMYWSEDDDINLTVIRNCMSRNRYMEIKKFLHFNNNDKIKDTNDKSFKIKPLIDQLNENFLKVEVFSKYISIDEQMVRYYGAHFLKQFIRGKPIRFGFKQWIMLCAETGYCFQMELYQGKNDSQQNDLRGLGERVISSMVNLLECPEDHEIYFDNFFTSFHLMQSLSEKNIRATGTARANRINNCPIKNDSIMKKERRGDFDYQFDKKNEILAVTWRDNSCVKVLTNHQTVHPLATVKRYDKLEKRKIDVQQPYVIAQYNKYMGGVDKLDWHVNKYKIKIRGKKWYFRLFTNAIDIAMYNAFVMYNLSHEKVSYLDFIRQITRTYLNVSSDLSNPKLTGRPSRSLKDTRVITDHVLERTLEGKQKRCAVCKKNCRKQCAGCSRAMHMNCFSAFHTTM